MHPYMNRQLFFWGQSSGGHWAPDEAHQHINCLELKAAYPGLQSSYKNLSHTHVRIFLDNISAVSYINNMGGTHSLECNQIATTIWMWCIAWAIWLPAAHLPGKCNTPADKASRIFHGQAEWKLDSNIYVSITQALEAPSIDLFASRLNFQAKPYKAWHPDPGAIYAFFCWLGGILFLRFSSIQFHWQVEEGGSWPSLEDTYCATADNTGMASNFVVPPCSGTSHSSSRKESAPAAIKPYNPYAFHPLHHKWTLMACKSSGCLYKFQRLSEQVIDTVMSSWWESTKKQYRTYLMRWHKFSAK